MADKEEVTGFSLPKPRQKMKMSSTYGEMYSNGRTPTAEEKLRNENPGLQELWDQYQTMLKLCTPAKEIQESSGASTLDQIRSRLMGTTPPPKKLQGSALNRIKKLKQALEAEEKNDPDLF